MRNKKQAMILEWQLPFVARYGDGTSPNICEFEQKSVIIERVGTLKRSDSSIKGCAHVQHSIS